MTSGAEARATETGGRQATSRLIPPKLALAVGMPSTPAPKGWKWKLLSSLARLESGHTPSRRHPEYWGGDIPWIGIADAKAHHGRRIEDTIEKTNSLGIANSSARVLPENTVCLSRTASIGYVVVTGRPMATSQDFVNWVCSKELDPNFLKYLFIAEGDDLLRFGSGAVHPTIYFPEVKAFYICVPDFAEQQRIVYALDEAFERIAASKVNAEKNCKNVRAIFESQVQRVFARGGDGWQVKTLEQVVDPSCTLSYGIVQPGEEYTDGLPIVRPTDLAHKTVQLSGLKRIDPKLARAYRRTMLQGCELLLCVRGSTGVVAKASSELAGGNVTRGIVPILLDRSLLREEFAFHLMCSKAIQSQIRKKTYGAALMQINIRDLRNLIVAFPSLREQKIIATQLDALASETESLVSIYQQKLEALDALKESMLHQAFAGELTKQLARPVVIPLLTIIPGITTTDLHAGILATAYDLHEQKNTQKHFGHVKAEKIAHMVEAHAGIDLGRAPIKDAAGPNDYPHQQRVEHRARKAGYFDFKRVGDARYQVKKLPRFNSLIRRAREKLGDQVQGVDELITLMLPMTTQQAEIFATVYAAWSNLLLDGQSPTDEQIVYEARENWHPEKLKIPREKFFKAIAWLREKGIVPNGRGRKVAAKSTA